MPLDCKILPNLEVCIAGIGAAVYSTPHIQGIVVTNKTEGNNGATVGNT